jgi:molybdate transport system substrate-binding protein
LSNTGKFYEIPESTYPRLEQGAVLTKNGATNPVAKTYIAFLRSERARVIFDRYGFRLPK